MRWTELVRRKWRLWVLETRMVKVRDTTRWCFHRVCRMEASLMMLRDSLGYDVADLLETERELSELIADM